MSLTLIAERLRRRLPHSTQRLIKALGWEDALLFLRRHGQEGGRCVYVPIKYNKSNGLFAGMDQAKCESLIREFGGQDLELSGPKKMLASERYQLVVRDYQDRAFTMKMLCEKYKMPRQTISWIINELGN